VPLNFCVEEKAMKNKTLFAALLVLLAAANAQVAAANPTGRLVKEILFKSKGKPVSAHIQVRGGLRGGTRQYDTSIEVIDDLTQAMDPSILSKEVRTLTTLVRAENAEIADRVVLRILKNHLKSGVIDEKALNDALARISVNNGPVESSGLGKRIWSYKSGALIVKGKAGNLEYEQSFTVSGVLKTAALGSAIVISICATQSNLQECKDDYFELLISPTSQKAE
jgi:opacity protein-like surface antigen